jgi:hypothetical protein
MMPAAIGSTPSASSLARAVSFAVQTSGQFVHGVPSCHGIGWWWQGTHFIGTCQSDDVSVKLVADLVNGNLSIEGVLKISGSTCQVNGALRTPSGTVTVELSTKSCAGGFASSVYFSPGDLNTHLVLDMAS